MTLCRLLQCVFLLVSASVFAGEWRAAEDLAREEVRPGFSYVKRIAVRGGDGEEVTAHLAFFTSRAFRLEVVDLGAGPSPAYQTLEEAFRAAGALAGTNGGFFHPDWRPLGLVIAQGQRINRLETSKLLGGVVYSDAQGIDLVRRDNFRGHAGIHALLQSGPYLVEDGQPVRGLSKASPRRRTFIATDWRGNWLLGATLSLLSLDELAHCLASAGALADWPVDRALNLDGGSSTGFFFERGPGMAPVLMRPAKRVRNLLGIVPRRAPQSRQD